MTRDDPRDAKLVEDVIAAKLRAKAREAEAEAKREEAINKAIEEGQGGRINIKETNGGVSINGSANVGGSVVGGDLIGNSVTTTYSVDAAAVAKLFDAVNQKIDARPEDPNVDKDELKDTVKKIEDEVKKGEEANPAKVERWLKFLGGMADDIFQVTAATLANPAAGIGKAIQLIARKAKEQAASG